MNRRHFLIAGVAGATSLVLPDHSWARSQADELELVPGAPLCDFRFRDVRSLTSNLHLHTKIKKQWPDHLLSSDYQDEVKRDKRAGFQCLAISDHSQYIGQDYWMKALELSRTTSQPYPPFVLLPAYEWTVEGLVGEHPVAHINAIGQKEVWSVVGAEADLPGKVVPNLASFYQMVADRADTHGDHAVYQFNHPWAGTSHFNNFAPPACFAKIRRQFTLIEIDSGMRNELRKGLAWYDRALQQGWRVAPTINSDAEGGLNKSDLTRATGIWVSDAILPYKPALAVQYSLLTRWVYAKRAPAAIALVVTNGKHIQRMGQAIYPDKQGRLELQIRVTADPGSRLDSPVLFLHEVRRNDVRKVALLTNRLSRSKDRLAGTAFLSPTRDVICYYVVYRDGHHTLVSAPIWVANAGFGAHDLGEVPGGAGNFYPGGINPDYQFQAQAGVQYRFSLRRTSHRPQQCRISTGGVIKKFHLRVNHDENQSYVWPHKFSKPTELILEAFTGLPCGWWKRSEPFIQTKSDASSKHLFAADEFASDVGLELIVERLT